MLFSMLGSIFSSRRDFTKVVKRPPVQTTPYKSDLPGFNTRFSLHELDQKVLAGRPLTPDEQEFWNHVNDR